MGHHDRVERRRTGGAFLSGASRSARGLPRRIRFDRTTTRHELTQHSVTHRAPVKNRVRMSRH